MNPLEPGQQLDHFLLEATVARGGMATIFRAIDLRTQRQVAIKVPHFEAESDPVFFERFQREAELGRRLDHPGLIRVLPDSGRSRMYMVMEWAEGKLLREVLNEQRPFPIERAVRIAGHMCDALQYIHSQGVVHRDLKPENIIVDSHDNVKLIDFGIAGLSGARRLTFGKLSNTIGTPDYISPEQVRGRRGDARSDIYALGVMLYEMLTGQVPFPEQNPLSAMNARLRHAPTAPRKYNAALSPQLESVVLRALERDPERRYASAQEFARDLRHPDQVAIYAHEQKSSGRQTVWFAGAAAYAGFLLIPTVIFALLFYVARHQ